MNNYTAHRIHPLSGAIAGKIYGKMAAISREMASVSREMKPISREIFCISREMAEQKQVTRTNRKSL
jgi:hypothetical protein